MYISVFFIYIYIYIYPMPSTNNCHRAWDQYSACVWNATVLSLKRETPAISFWPVLMLILVDNRKWENKFKQT